MPRSRRELRAHADRISGRFHLDAPGWYTEAGAHEAPYLTAVADAVWNNRVLHVVYRRWKEPTDVERRLEPYGLVLKAGRWYVVAGPGPRTFRVDQILQLTLMEQEFMRPADFDLAAHWAEYQRGFHERLYRDRAEAVVRLAPGVALTRATRLDEPPAADGWTTVTVPIESVEHAHAEFLRLGADVEVLRPAGLRARIARTVTELAAKYGDRLHPGTGEGTAPVRPLGPHGGCGPHGGPVQGLGRALWFRSTVPVRDAARERAAGPRRFQFTVQL